MTMTAAVVSEKVAHQLDHLPLPESSTICVQLRATAQIRKLPGTLEARRTEGMGNDVEGSAILVQVRCEHKKTRRSLWYGFGLQWEVLMPEVSTRCMMMAAKFRSLSSSLGTLLENLKV